MNDWENLLFDKRETRLLEMITGPWIPQFPRLGRFIPFFRRFGHYESKPITISTRQFRVPLTLRKPTP